MTIETAAGRRTAALGRWPVVIFLTMLMIGVAVLSLVAFSGQSLRLDESQSLWQTSHSPSAMLKIVAEDVHVPLYHFILHYWQLAFGNGIEVARSLSLLFFILIIPAVYVLGRRAMNETVGLYAALLSAVSPFLNWYGNEVRMYSLFTLLVILNQYCFIGIWQQERRPGRQAGSARANWIGYAVTAVLGIFTHYFFFLNLLTQAIFFLLYRRSFPKNAFRGFVLVLIMLLIVFAPWMYFVLALGAAGNTQPVLSRPTPVDLFNTLFEFVFGFQGDKTNTTFVSLWPLIVLFLFLSLRRHQTVPPAAVYFFFGLFVPIIAAYGVSAGFKPLYLSRYLILALPALYLLLSWVLSTYPPRLSAFMKSVLVASMVVMLAVQIVNADAPVKENYREASDYLASKATPRDIIVLSAPFTIYPFEYYYNGPARLATLPVWDRNQSGEIPAFSEQRLESDVKALSEAHEKIWILLSYDQGYEDQVRLYFDTHYARVDVKKFSHGLTLYGYRLRYDTLNTLEALDYIDHAGLLGKR